MIKFLLLFLIFVNQVYAACSSPISRSNNSPNTVLTSAKYNLDLNTVYTKVNDLDGDCISDTSIPTAKLENSAVTSAKIANGTIVKADLAAEVLNQAGAAKTSTYTLTSDDDVITVNSSGGAFTLNLPAAASVSGKVYTIIKTNTELNKVTIDPSGTETVRGALTVGLYTQDEVWQIWSDGSNWQSRYHNTKSRKSATTTITFGATTTPPTKGNTIVIDDVRWYRDGSDAIVFYNYEHQTNAGANGSGAYLISLPTGLIADTSVVSLNTATTATNDSSGKGVMLSSFAVSNGSNAASLPNCIAHLYSTTQFKVVNTSGPWGSAVVASFSSTAMRFSGWVRVPIDGWDE